MPKCKNAISQGSKSKVIRSKGHLHFQNNSTRRYLEELVVP
jgi:hypothetical protein